MSHKLVSVYIGDGEYYTRTDADNVIAELKDEIHNLKRSLILARHAVANARGKNVSHKYRTKVEKFKEAK